MKRHWLTKALLGLLLPTVIIFSFQNCGPAHLSGNSTSVAATAVGNTVVTSSTPMPTPVVGQSPSPSPTVAPALTPTPTTTPYGLPDVVVTSISWSPSVPSSSTPMTFSATVYNQGTGATPAGVVIGVSFWIDGTQVSWSDNYSTSLLPGQSVTLTADYGPSDSASVSVAAGQHSLEAWVNDIGRFDESDTDNNKTTVDFDVPN